MSIQRQKLAELEFSHTHTIIIAGEMPEFQMVLDSPNTASVYIWVSPTEVLDEFEVLYVGKAGFGAKRRLRQHYGGFVNSGTGRKNRVLITDWIASGRSIMVFARVSATHQIFGIDVSLYSTEEHALCDWLLPRWNRASFPRARAEPLLQPAQIEPIEIDFQPADIGVINGTMDGDEITAFFGSISAVKQGQFAQLVSLIEQRDPEASQKVVGGYSGMPGGYNAKPMLVFGKIRPSGLALRSSGRIPLVDEEHFPLTVIFRSSDRKPDIDESLIIVGRNGCWRPIDLMYFLQNSDAYLREARIST